MAKKLIIVGSPRKNGRSAQLAQSLATDYRHQSSQDTVTVFSLAEHKVQPCTACDQCKYSYQCVIKDKMQQLYPLLDQSDELTIVSPVFFAGPPAQLKALLDRLQPYFWKRRAQNQPSQKRKARLYVIGEGGDPHGFDPLVISTRSALAVAGFSLDEIHDCVKRKDSHD